MEGVGTKRRKKRWHKSQRYTGEEGTIYRAPTCGAEEVIWWPI